MAARIVGINALGLLLPWCLIACTNSPNFKDEIIRIPVVLSAPSISYLSISFPEIHKNNLALQVAFVKYKEKAVYQERWLLRHEISYQWLLVNLHGEQWHLLAVGPFDSQYAMSQQRAFLQTGLGSLESMPAITLSTAEKK